MSWGHWLRDPVWVKIWSVVLLVIALYLTVRFLTQPGLGSVDYVLMAGLGFGLVLYGIVRRRVHARARTGRDKADPVST